jgi:hypothetical protein
MLVTLDDIQNGTTEPAWLCSLSGWGRTGNKYATARQFSDSIRRFILTWHDANSSAYVFSRISDKSKSVAKALRLDTRMGFDHAGNFINLPGDLTAESLIKAICNESSNAATFLSTPFFRREAQRVANAINALYHKPDGKLEDVCIPYKLWYQQLRLVNALTSVYGADAAVDHIQKMYQIGAHLTVRDIRPGVAKWFRTNTPITSFIQWFERALKAQQQEWQAAPESMRRSARCSETEQPTFNFNSFNDTINMMATLHVRQTEDLEYPQREAALLDLEAPSRWRLAEFHDHVSAKVWLTSNKNEDLPQDLFPAPIKVGHHGSTWTFFQPRDIHQLGQWGQAVRNCVGNASGYREDVKKKVSFIVLAMIDQKPRFTIQLKVRNGVLEVDQIADIGNRRLDDNERSSYELTFSKALILQDRLLPAQVEAET